MRTRLILASLCLLLAGAMLMWAGGQGEGGKEEGPITLTHWSFIDPAGDNVRSRAHAYVHETFMEANPNIKVEVNVIGWQQLDPMLVKAATTGKVPDTSMVYHPSLAMHVNAESIQPLDPYVNGWPQDKKDDFVAPWSATQINGKKWGFHYDHRVTGMMYRQDILDDNGLAAPRDMDEMIEQCLKLSDLPNRIAWLSGANSKNYASVLERVMPLAYSGGSVLIEDDGTTDAAGDGWVKAVDHWRKVVHEWKLLPQDLALAHTDETQSIFISGKGVFYIQPSHRLGFTRDKSGLGDKIQYGPIPAFKDNTTAPVAIFGWILVMPKGAKHPEAAVKFIDHFISPEMQAHLSEHATYTPVRKSASEFPWFQTDAAADVRNFMEMASANPLQPLILPEHANELFTMIGGAIEKVIINPNSVTPKAALQEVADEYNRKYAK